MGVFFNPFITWSGHNYHIDKNLMYKTKPMGASSSFILHTAKHVFIDHMLSYALWQLGAQPYLSFHHHLCCLHSAGRQVSSCLPTPALCFLSSPRPAHCTPHTHSHFLCKSLWTLISKELLLFAQLLSLSFLSTIFDHSHLMSVPYFLKLDCKTTIIFPYNTCIMTPYEFLPETLEGKKHARCLFSGSVRANVPVLDRSTWEVNTETIPFCFHIMLFLCIVLLRGIRDTRLERKTCREGKIRTQRVAQEEREERRETENWQGDVIKWNPSHFQTAVNTEDIFFVALSHSLVNDYHYALKTIS